MITVIPFTQFMRPHGRQVPQTMSLDEFSDGIVPLVEDLLNEGYVFHAELLRTGVASFTCCKGDDVDNEAGHVLAPGHDPEVILIVTELILTAHDRVFHE